jgi:hypothetical protein
LVKVYLKSITLLNTASRMCRRSTNQEKENILMQAACYDVLRFCRLLQLGWLYNYYLNISQLM